MNKNTKNKEKYVYLFLIFIDFIGEEGEEDQAAVSKGAEQYLDLNLIPFLQVFESEAP